jgi:TonB-linked SusC/RagA family outer membrane protein
MEFKAFCYLTSKRYLSLRALAVVKPWLRLMTNNFGRQPQVADLNISGRWFSTKTMLVMKLTSFLILAACLQLSAKGLSQTVTFSGKNVPLEKVFDAVKQQTGYLFFYKVEMMADAKPVTVKAEGVELETFLTALLKDQPLTYSVVNKAIVISRRPSVGTSSDRQPRSPGTDDQYLSGTDTSLPRSITVRGVVYNESGQPLSGANVTIKETGKGTITNARGEFELPTAPANGTLVISFIGYASQQVKISSETNKISIYLKIANNQLDKVVVQGYGTTTQRLTTGNIATVTAAEIERQPVMNPLAALEGQVPGVVVTQNNGYASSPFKVEIRGRSVIDGSQPSEPLYIIDGVPLTVLNLSGSNYASGSSGFVQNTGLLGPAGGQSPFFSINPQDIENITVLKDADATAIYGSRGANGVIIINTKSGKAGKSKLDINVYQGISEVTGRYKLLNTQQYLMMRREAFHNDGIAMNAGNAYDLLTWDTTRYTDWQKIYWGGIGHATDAEVSLSGGERQNTFRIGGSYHTETGILIHSGADERGTVQFNYTHKSLDQRFTLSMTSVYSYTQSDLIYVAGSGLQAPDAPSIYTPSGALNWAGWQPVPGNLIGGTLLQNYSSNTSFLNSQLKLQYELAKGLSFSAQVGYSTMHNSQMYLIPIVSQNPYTNPKGRAFFGNTNGMNTIVEPQLEYLKMIGRGKLNVLVGGTNQGVSNDVIETIGTGYINDNLLKSVSNAPVKSATDGYGTYRYAALFGRINYNWDNKYLLNLSARRDGSSRFGPGKQYGNFGAIGLGWIFTEESWFKDQLSILSFGKIRGSYGITGNDQISDYGYLTQWSASGLVPYQAATSYVPLIHANPNLQWETNKKLEIAGDLGFFKDRLTMELSWYRNRCGNQLVSEPLPILTGFSTVMTNLNATLQNSGWEMILRGKIIEKKNFSWSANFNIGLNRNKLISFPGLAPSPYASSLTIGQSLSIVRLLHYTGVNPQTGQYTFQDKNHNGKIDYSYNNGNNDLYNKDLAIKFEGGIGTEVIYKAVQLNIFANFRKRQAYAALYNGTPGSILSNQSVAVLNRWQKPGDHAQFARFTTSTQLSDELINASDGVYTDGSFLRIRNISLSYGLPGKWTSKAGLQHCKLYVRAQNLFVFTPYKGVDPEVNTLGGLPPAKNFVGGIQFIF